MKKFILFISIFFSLFSVISCSSEQKEKNPETVFVTFKNHDDSVLFHTEIPYGSKVNYQGETPIKESDEQNSYVFSGWDKDVSKNIYDNTIFIAQFSANVQKYEVQFLNYDGTLLSSVNVEYGNTVKYNGKIPTKNSDDEHIEYKFKGWDKDISDYKITGNISLIAQFETIEYVFAKFYNYDNTHIKTIKIIKGEKPYYDGNTPTRSYSGDDKVYKFIGWDIHLTPINSDTTYIAEFKLFNIYTVTFKNYDGSELSTVKVIEGETAVYTGSTPYRSSSTSGDYITKYTFNGWSSSLSNITSNKSVTAQFSSSTQVTGKTEIKQYLNNYGSGEYHLVSTGDGTQLGYYDDIFMVGCSTDSDGTKSEVAISFRYGSNIGYAAFQIVENGITMYKASMEVRVVSHKYYSMTLTRLDICRYTSDKAELLAALSILMVQDAIDSATKFLENHSMSYIY